MGVNNKNNIQTTGSNNSGHNLTASATSYNNYTIQSASDLDDTSQTTFDDNHTTPPVIDKTGSNDRYGPNYSDNHYTLADLTHPISGPFYHILSFLPTHKSMVIIEMLKMNPKSLKDTKLPSELNELIWPETLTDLNKPRALLRLAIRVLNTYDDLKKDAYYVPQDQQNTNHSSNKSYGRFPCDLSPNECGIANQRDTTIVSLFTINEYIDDHDSANNQQIDLIQPLRDELSKLYSKLYGISNTKKPNEVLNIDINQHTFSQYACHNPPIQQVIQVITGLFNNTINELEKKRQSTIYLAPDHEQRLNNLVEFALARTTKKGMKHLIEQRMERFQANYKQSKYDLRQARLKNAASGSCQLLGGMTLPVIGLTIVAGMLGGTGYICYLYPPPAKSETMEQYWHTFGIAALALTVLSASVPMTCFSLALCALTLQGCMKCVGIDDDDVHYSKNSVKRFKYLANTYQNRYHLYFLEELNQQTPSNIEAHEQPIAKYKSHDYQKLTDESNQDSPGHPVNENTTNYGSFDQNITRDTYTP